MKFIKQIFKSKVIPINTKPLVTGSGPFIELPKFIPVGESLLNITLPKHSQLSIRNGSLLAINGDLNDISSIAIDQYQQLKAVKPVSLVINGDSYSIIETKNDWTILNDENLIAYTGYNFDITPISILNKFNSVRTKGQGTIVLNENLFNIELDENEEIMINPNALIATTSELHYKILYKSSGNSSKSWSLPKYGIIGTLFNPINGILDKVNKYKTDTINKLTTNKTFHDVNVYTQPIRTSVKKAIDWIYLYLSTIIKRKPIYIKVKGPSKLLINNNPLVSNSKIFTRTEIKTIYNQ